MNTYTLLVAGLALSSPAWAVDMVDSATSSTINITDTYAFYTSPEVTTDLEGLRFYSGATNFPLPSFTCPSASKWPTQADAIADNCGLFTDNQGGSGSWSFFNGVNPGPTGGTAADFQNTLQVIYQRPIPGAGALFTFTEYWQGQIVGPVTTGPSTTAASCPNAIAACPTGTQTFCGDALLFDSEASFTLWSGASQMCIDDSFFSAI